MRHIMAMKAYIVLGLLGLLTPAYGLSFDTIYETRVDTHGVLIVWQTDTASNGNIEYGLGTADANQMSIEMTMALQHQTSIYGLLEGEDYMFRIRARSRTGGQAQSPWHRFRTLGIPAPKILEVAVVEATPEGGTLVWRSNIPTRGTFECGYDTSYGFQQTDDRYGAAHEVIVKRFNPRKTIHYRVRAVDERGLEAPEHAGTFVTAERNIAVGAKVTGTFTRNVEPSYIKDPPPILDRVTDGGLDYYTGMASSGDPKDADQWVEIDLGKIAFVSDIVTMWWQLAYPKKFSVKLSLNRETWRALGDTYDASTGQTAKSRSGDPLWEHFAQAGSVLARYVRIDIPQGAPYERRFPKFNYVTLFELKVYPPEEKHD